MRHWEIQEIGRLKESVKWQQDERSMLKRPVSIEKGPALNQ
jgi:hypothetical protein